MRKERKPELLLFLYFHQSLIRETGDGCNTFGLSSYDLQSIHSRTLKVLPFVQYKYQCLKPLKLYHRIYYLMSNTRTATVTIYPTKGGQKELMADG